MPLKHFTKKTEHVLKVNHQKVQYSEKKNSEPKRYSETLFVSLLKNLHRSV